MKRSLLLVSLTIAALGTTGCFLGGPKNDPILQLAAQESLEQGKALMEEEKYKKARDYLTHAFEVEPNSRTGREALLLAADCYFLDGGVSNYIQAEAKYRDFLNRFPTSDQAAYAQFQIANSLAQRIEKPDRDQSATMDALSAYRELIRLYPTSEYAEEAEENLDVVRENLAAHELTVGRFNYKYRNYPGARLRLENLVENYPEFSRLDEALYLLGMTYRQSSAPEMWIQAIDVFERLRDEFPDSPYAQDVPSLAKIQERIQAAEAAKEERAETGTEEQQTPETPNAPAVDEVGG